MRRRRTVVQVLHGGIFGEAGVKIGHERSDVLGRRQHVVSDVTRENEPWEEQRPDGRSCNSSKYFTKQLQTYAGKASSAFATRSKIITSRCYGNLPQVVAVKREVKRQGDPLQQQQQQQKHRRAELDFFKKQDFKIGLWIPRLTAACLYEFDRIPWTRR